jgi:hypothetical protein
VLHYLLGRHKKLPNATTTVLFFLHRTTVRAVWSNHITKKGLKDLYDSANMPVRHSLIGTVRLGPPSFRTGAQGSSPLPERFLVAYRSRPPCPSCQSVRLLVELVVDSFLVDASTRGQRHSGGGTEGRLKRLSGQFLLKDNGQHDYTMVTPCYEKIHSRL